MATAPSRACAPTCRAACAARSYWKEKSSDEYKDGALALRMKRAVCPNPDVNSCALDQLPSDYEPLRADECASCHERQPCSLPVPPFPTLPTLPTLPHPSCPSYRSC